jgi:hypothetical protein
LATPVLPQQPAPARKLNIVIVEGEGAINNVRQRTAREPIVQVEDENRRPVAGAIVIFTLPDQGASGVFLDGSRTLTVTTGPDGRAVARGFRPNNVEGKIEIRVNASQSGAAPASATITQINQAVVGAAAAGGVSGKLIAILAIAGGAAAGGIVAATRGGNGNGTQPTSTQPPATVIAPGSATVGPPR